MIPYCPGPHELSVHPFLSAAHLCPAVHPPVPPTCAHQCNPPV
ncbi:unnamed protein product, partial [Staurois parvus]